MPKVQIVIGVLALVVAAILVATPRRGGDRRPVMMATRARRLLNGSSLWVAGFAGMGIALPSADYLSALAVILASGAAAVTQVSGLMMFNAVAFALVEIPLVASLVAPDKTRASMAAVNDWVRSRSRRDVAVLLAVVGCVLLAIGIAGL